MTEIDLIRQRFPHIGVGVYAFTPGGDLTLEVYVDDRIYSWQGPSLGPLLAEAFGTYEGESGTSSEHLPNNVKQVAEPYHNILE